MKEKVKTKRDKKETAEVKSGVIGCKKLREKLDMYDMLIASSLDRNTVIEPEEVLGSREMHLGFSNISTREYISKYYVISKLPDYIPEDLFGIIRNRCMADGVVVEFEALCKPHFINWDSNEMRDRMRIWKDYVNETGGEVNSFNYRSKKYALDNKRRIIISTKYLNNMDLDENRTLLKVCIVIKITAHRDDESILNMINSIESLKTVCNNDVRGMRVKELRIDLVEWMRAINPFSLKEVVGLRGKMPYKLVTDDILANMNGLIQGSVGDTGIPLGVDILSNKVVMEDFGISIGSKDAKNVLVGGETGSGKSRFIKPLIPYLLNYGVPGTIMDYEGDEYINLANYIRAGKTDDVCIVSVGKESARYYDPCPIPEFVGDKSIDNELKEQSIEYIKMSFRIMVKGTDEELSNYETKAISIAIVRMYEAVGVTDNKETWYRSKNCRLKDVYTVAKSIVERREFFDPDGGNRLHSAFVNIVDSASVFFEDGEIYSNAFKEPIGLDEIYKARLVLFSFGMRGVTSKVSDSKIVALKQIGISYLNTLKSNYCYYVEGKYNFKIWEEAQRWFKIDGSSDTITNEITGGRKRGAINIIATNDLSGLLESGDSIGEMLKQNIQYYFLGRIASEEIRTKVCKEFGVEHIRDDLDKIAMSKIKKGKTRGDSSKTRNKYNKYRYSFCCVLPTGETPIVKSRIPSAIAESQLYERGRIVK